MIKEQILAFIDYPLEKARLEVDACVKVWKGILARRFGDRIEYAYVKGSCVKPWDSPIDYVPVISDVDIHFKLREAALLFASDEPFEEALGVAEEYEREFRRAVKFPLHIPRPQVMVLNRHIADLEFIMPSKMPEANMLIGSYPSVPAPSVEFMRRVDAKNISALRSLIAGLPESAMDRSGIDYLNLIRRLSYEVTPAPVRLLSLMDESREVWGLNRTHLVERLREQDFTDLADAYRSYYLEGWTVFLKGFSDLKRIRVLLRHAYRVLQLTLRHADERGLLDFIIK